MPRIGVIGAGIAGLSAAYQLHQKDIAVQVLEATDRPGGVIQSHPSDGFLVEAGPNSLRPTPLLEEIVTNTSLEQERVPANEIANRRYIVRDGRPTPVPMSVGSFLTSDLFSMAAKFRLLAEPFVSRRSHSASDESLADFTRRRLGREVLDYAVAPFVGGVFAGDPDQLSARHAFERLVEWEEDYGSLFWGAIRSGSKQTSNDDTSSRLFSFHDGLERLPRRLAEILGNRVTYNAPVTALHHDDDQWLVRTESSSEETYTFDAVINTAPLYRFTQMSVETPIDRSPLSGVYYPPVHVLGLGYPRSAIDHPLDGFGLLVPPVEDDFDILGTLFSSTLFPNRAPDDHVLLTTFVGGARDPDQAQESPDAIETLVQRDLDALLGVTGDPVFVHHTHWSKAIPQYSVGYGAVKHTLHSLEDQHPGLFFAGNFREGVSVGDALESGASAADRAASSL